MTQSWMLLSNSRDCLLAPCEQLSEASGAVHLRNLLRERWPWTAEGLGEAYFRVSAFAVRADRPYTTSSL
jgi:hypothetical protein